MYFNDIYTQEVQFLPNKPWLVGLGGWSMDQGFGEFLILTILGKPFGPFLDFLGKNMQKPFPQWIMWEISLSCPPIMLVLGNVDTGTTSGEPHSGQSSSRCRSSLSRLEYIRCVFCYTKATYGGWDISIYTHRIHGAGIFTYMNGWFFMGSM